MQWNGDREGSKVVGRELKLSVSAWIAKSGLLVKKAVVHVSFSGAG